ncbi:MAG: hypothetical protein QQN63_04630 [Nitrosopumilus sp.]
MKAVIRSKQDMVSVMGIYLAEMRPWMDKSGVSQLALNITTDWEMLPMSWIREAWHWIDRIRINELRDINKVRSLLPEILWDKYENWGGHEDLREMCMMKKVLDAFKKEVISNGRPQFFKKTSVKRFCKAKIREEKAKAKAKAKGNHSRRSS